MIDRIVTNKRSPLRPQFFVLPILVLFTSPALSVLSVVTLVTMSGVYTRIERSLFWPLLYLVGAFCFALLSILLYSPHTSEVTESAKFLFMGLIFWVGFSSRLDPPQINKLAMLLLSAILGWYIFYVVLGIEIPFIYPPDFNNSVILMLFFAFYLTENRGLLFRMCIVVILVLFSQIANSRTMLLFIPAFFTSQPISLSIVRVTGLIALISVSVFWMASTEKFGSFSDFVRLAIYESSISVVAENGLHLFAEGPQIFVDRLNEKLPSFVTDIVEINHAHNAFLEVAGSYGLGAVIGYTAFFIGLLRFSIQEKNNTLRNQIIILLILMLVEAMISDSRVLFTILLFLGMQAGHTIKSRTPRIDT